jgi:DUF1680 family protein
MKRWVWLAMCVMAGGQAMAGAEQAGSHAKLRAVPLRQVEIRDPFWAPRIEINRTSTLPHDLKMCEDTGRISNFDKAAGRMEGDYEGRFYNDSDVYKILEGAAYTLMLHPDPALEARIDAIIEKIATAQQPDGYIYAYYTVMDPDKRWTNLADMHELYCAGHMFEAAVAWANATGRTNFLDVARKMADNINSVFGFDQRIGTPGHEEIELALVKLYRETGEERYRKLAEFFVAARGTGPEPKSPYRQDDKPVKEHEEIVGHAVRAMYLYSGVADVAALTGDADYIKVLERIWQDVVHRKVYVTGGVGAEHRGEAFGGAYHLPNDSAYAETCAGIGLALWNHRLLLLHGEGRFADVLEKVLYNALPASVSLKGDTFFYVNPLESSGKHHRQPWYGTACCPSNVVRVVPQVGSYVYATGDDGIWVNLYMANTGRIELGDGEVQLAQETQYPWDGAVKLTVTPEKARSFALHLRRPGWCNEMAVRMNGDALERTDVNDGYIALARTWKPGDVVEIDMAMPVQRMVAHPKVESNRGRVALQRGPIVYCFEAVDNGGSVFDKVLPRDAKLSAEHRSDVLGGVTVVKARGLSYQPLNWEGELYQPAPEDAGRPVELTAVPYAVWDNREAGEMTVWIPELPSK